MNILFSYENDGDAATVTASLEHPSFPTINVQHRWFVKPWRTTYVTPATAYLRFAMIGSPQLDFIAIKNHNIQSGVGHSTVINYYTAGWGGIALSETLTWKTEMMAAIINAAYPCIEILIIDAGNPDTYLEIGRVWMGEAIRPRIGFSMERTVSPQDPSVISESENGQEASIQRSHFNSWNYIFEGVDPNDKASMDAMFAAVGTSKALFICEKPDEADVTPYTYYIRFVSWEWEHLAGDWWKLILEVKEER